MTRPTVTIAPYRFSVFYAWAVGLFVVLLSMVQAGYLQRQQKPQQLQKTGDMVVENSWRGCRSAPVTTVME